MLEIELLFVLPKFRCRFLLILKHGFLPDFKSKMFYFGFFGFLVSSAFRG